MVWDAIVTLYVVEPHCFNDESSSRSVISHL